MIATGMFGDRTPLNGRPSLEGYSVFSVGERYPGELPPMGNHLLMGNCLQMIVRMQRPSPKEVEGFRKIQAYGFYVGSDLPQGVLIWDFGQSLSSETPFNPRREEIIRPDEVRAFLCGEVNLCQRVLLDENGTVLAIGMLGMDWQLIGLLKSMWGDPNRDWSDYEDRYMQLSATTSTKKMWSKAQKWKVKSHLFGGGLDETNATMPGDKTCGECEAAHESVGRMKKALKQAEGREAELREKTMGLQSHIATLEKDQVGLQERIASLTNEEQARETAALKVVIQELEFRILEKDEDVSERDKKAKVHEGQIDDMGRRIKWLESRLRANGIGIA